jgi:hypothetical protein
VAFSELVNDARNGLVQRYLYTPRDFSKIGVTKSGSDTDFSKIGVRYRFFDPAK